MQQPAGTTRFRQCRHGSVPYRLARATATCGWTATATAQRYGGLVDVLGRQIQLQTLAITGTSGSN